MQSRHTFHLTFLFILDKKPPGKSKEEAIADKKQELERRLLDVNDKIGTTKKVPKKGNNNILYRLIRFQFILTVFLFLFFSYA